MTNIVRLSDYWKPQAADRIEQREISEQALREMGYDALLKWCGDNFGRLVAAAEARDYRPGWIEYQLAEHRRYPSAREVPGTQTVEPGKPYRSAVLDAAGSFSAERQHARQMEARRDRSMKRIDRGPLHRSVRLRSNVAQSIIVDATMIPLPVEAAQGAERSGCWDCTGQAGGRSVESVGPANDELRWTKFNGR